jgi:Zn-dependent peptidase ImmA (M78 family)
MAKFPLNKYSTKEEIYRTVNYLKCSLKLNSYPLNSKKILQRFCKNLTIECLPFVTSDICGILYKGDTSTSIGLNQNRSEDQQNFDCMHEGIHYFSHDISYCKCVCSEKNIISQESSIEYQANEGAAQCLVPYERFIPEISNLYDDAMSSDEIDFFIAKLAQKYHVTSAVISVRLQSLKYEIWQYMSGTAIKHLRILSDRHQKQEGIEVESIIDKRNKKRIEENQNYRIYIRQCNA